MQQNKFIYCLWLDGLLYLISSLRNSTFYPFYSAGAQINEPRVFKTYK